MSAFFGHTPLLGKWRRGCRKGSSTGNLPPAAAMRSPCSAGAGLAGTTHGPMAETTQFNILFQTSPLRKTAPGPAGTDAIRGPWESRHSAGGLPTRGLAGPQPPGTPPRDKGGAGDLRARAPGCSSRGDPPGLAPQQIPHSPQRLALELRASAPPEMHHHVAHPLAVQQNGGSGAVSPQPSPRLPVGCSAPYGGMAASGTTAAAALVQYVVLRGDLARPPRSWPLGAVVAQGCHAALAAAHRHCQHPDTRAYLELGGAMRTVVLEVRGARREPRGMLGAPPQRGGRCKAGSVEL